MVRVCVYSVRYNVMGRVFPDGHSFHTQKPTHTSTLVHTLINYWYTETNKRQEERTDDKN